MAPTLKRILVHRHKTPLANWPHVAPCRQRAAMVRCFHICSTREQPYASLASCPNPAPAARRQRTPNVSAAPAAELSPQQPEASGWHTVCEHASLCAPSTWSRESRQSLDVNFSSSNTVETSNEVFARTTCPSPACAQELDVMIWPAFCKYTVALLCPRLDMSWGLDALTTRCKARTSAQGLQRRCGDAGVLIAVDADVTLAAAMTHTTHGKVMPQAEARKWATTATLPIPESAVRARLSTRRANRARMRCDRGRRAITP